MGLRQSKRSVDISGSPKKETPAAVVEKLPPTTNDIPNQTLDESNVAVVDNEEKPANGDAKTSEPVELVKNSLNHDNAIVNNSIDLWKKIGEEYPGGGEDAGSCGDDQRHQQSGGIAFVDRQERQSEEEAIIPQFQFPPAREKDQRGEQQEW